MKIDVSEVKTFRECSRKWNYSSRNKFHLAPLAPNPNFMFGTLMHEALHAMYLGGNIDNILESTLRELSDPAQQRVMTTILRGYYENVLPQDLADYKVIDVEWGFHFTPPALQDTIVTDPETGEILDEGIVLCGSIDMITMRRDDRTIWGFEHKSAKTFRDAVYARMDEQPRLYTEALYHWIEMKNAAMHDRWVIEGSPIDKEPAPYKFGGILVNQCKKTVKFFQHQRDVCVYTPEDRARFMKSFVASCRAIKCGPEDAPEPGAMKCQMCGYKLICEEAGFEQLPLERILDEFSEEYAVREIDHLEEKMERPGPVDTE